MNENDMENLSDIHIRDTVDSNQINNTDLTSDDDKTRLTSSDVFAQNKKFANTKEELEKVPPIIKNYLDKNHLCIVNFKGIDPVQIIKAALLKKTDNVRAKDFLFQFNETQDFYFFITKELNQNYLKPVLPSNEKKKKFGKERRDSKESLSSISSEPNKIENKKIN